MRGDLHADTGNTGHPPASRKHDVFFGRAGIHCSAVADLDNA